MNGPFIVIIAGVACTAIGVLWLLVAHWRDRIDLVDVITEFDDRRGVRKASLRKLGEAVALGASTFVVIYDALKPAGANDLLMGLYLAAWVSRTLFGMLAQAKAGAITTAAAPPAGR